jgi:hypothetical protein
METERRINKIEIGWHEASESFEKRTKKDRRNICPVRRVKRPQNYGFEAHKAASTLQL